jgi:hypothetical protein
MPTHVELNRAPDEHLCRKQAAPHTRRGVSRRFALSRFRVRHPPVILSAAKNPAPGPSFRANCRQAGSMASWSHGMPHGCKRGASPLSGASLVSSLVTSGFKPRTQRTRGDWPGPRSLRHLPPPQPGLPLRKHNVSALHVGRTSVCPTEAQGHIVSPALIGSQVRAPLVILSAAKNLAPG